jgi:hypothetical protein
VGVAATVAFVIGGLLVLWSAYIHFHLWDETDGYRHISVIGPLFLLQSIGGLVVGSWSSPSAGCGWRWPASASPPPPSSASSSPSG